MNIFRKAISAFMALVTVSSTEVKTAEEVEVNSGEGDAVEAETTEKQKQLSESGETINDHSHSGCICCDL